VPVGEVNRVVPQIISKGKLIRPGLGITLANRTPDRGTGLGGRDDSQGPARFNAEKAGLRGTSQVRDGLVLGDIILAVNGKKVSDYDTLRDEVERYQVGQTVVLTLLRDAATVEVTCSP
jgi:S1-C subfamily serine protease